jgi:hypothetical protein
MRCPVCRADNNEGPNCRRCRADLSLLFQLEDSRARFLHQARQQAACANWMETARLAEQAHALRRDTDSASLAAIGWLMQAAFDRARELHRQVGNLGGAGGGA